MMNNILLQTMFNIQNNVYETYEKMSSKLESIVIITRYKLAFVIILLEIVDVVDYEYIHDFCAIDTQEEDNPISKNRHTETGTSDVVEVKDASIEN